MDFTVEDSSFTFTIASNNLEADISAGNSLVVEVENNSLAFEIVRPTLEFNLNEQQIVFESPDSSPEIINIEGGAAGSIIDGLIAGTNLSGHRVVVQDYDSGELLYADSGNLGHLYSVLGITTESALAGRTCKVRCFGSITEPTWAWEQNKPVFLGSNGHLTQTRPATGFLLRIGFPQKANTLFVDIDDPIKLL